MRFLLLLTLALPCFGQIKYSPTSFTAPFVSTVTNAASARTYLGITSGGLTNYGASITNFAIYGGTVTSQTNSDLTASRVMVSDANKKPASSSVTSTELGYVSGVTGALQTQVDAKAGLTSNNTFTGTNTFTGELVVATSFRTNSGLIYRKLWESNTNIFLSSVVGIVANDVTNNGDFVRCTAVQVATIPPLLSPHSQLLIFQGATPRTNTNPANASMFIGIGTNTNCIGRSTWAASSLGVGGGSFGAITMNTGSFTNQALLGGVNFGNFYHFNAVSN